MSVEVNLVGMKCGAQNGGLSCTYCYQGATRAKETDSKPVNHAAIQRAVLESGLARKGEKNVEGFSLFGGEALLSPVEDLEKLWAFGLETYGKNGVQTSGRPVTEEHLALFKRYQVHVGFSIDGPDELNDARRAGNMEQTRAATAHSIAMLKRCLAEGIGASLIVTLSKVNAAPARLPRLLDWFRELAACGLKDARLHILELDGAGRFLALTDMQNATAFLACHQLEKEGIGLTFDVFKDIRKLLEGRDGSGVTCTFAGCDPWRTTAVHGIGADGSRYMCTRVQKDGIPRRPAAPGPLVRNILLLETPQAQGGCQGCRFAILCKGQCPGTAIDGDWRNRTRDCAFWFTLFEHVEREVDEPVSRRADLPQLEARMKAAWELGIAATVQSVLEGAIQAGYFTATHADRPHGDAHGDHTDSGGAQ